MSPTAKALTKPTAAGVASDQKHGGNGEDDALHLDELRSSDMNYVRMQCYAQKCIGPTNDGIDRICPIGIVARVIALRCSSAIVRDAAKSSIDPVPASSGFDRLGGPRMASKPITDGFAQKTRTDRGFFYALGFLRGRVTARRR
jgi:hypothetical protein